MHDQSQHTQNIYGRIYNVGPESSKYLTALGLLQRGACMVFLDPSTVGVKLPLKYRTLKTLQLAIGPNVYPPTNDLVVTEEGFSATLVFDNRKYKCTVPWSAVFALTDGYGAGLAWAASLPEAVFHDPARLAVWN